MKLLCDGGYDFVESGGAYDAGSTDVEGSHCLSNPILNGKMQTLKKNDDDDDVQSPIIPLCLSDAQHYDSLHNKLFFSKFKALICNR